MPRSSSTARWRESAMVAAEQLAAEGLSVGVVDARFCKPVDGEMLARVLRPGHPVLTLEDHSLQNGFGTAVLEYAVAHDLPTEHLTRLGMPDRLIAHATRKEQLAEVGLDPPGIIASVRDAVRKSAARRGGAGSLTRPVTLRFNHRKPSFGVERRPCNRWLRR